MFYQCGNSCNNVLTTVTMFQNQLKYVMIIKDLNYHVYPLMPFFSQELKEHELNRHVQNIPNIINYIKSTFDYSLQLRKKFRQNIEEMKEYDKDVCKMILKNYAYLEASVKDENVQLGTKLS